MIEIIPDWKPPKPAEFAPSQPDTVRGIVLGTIHGCVERHIKPSCARAAWRKMVKDTECNYLSAKLCDPSFPTPIYATLVEVVGQERIQPIWSCPTVTDWFSNGSVTPVGPLVRVGRFGSRLVTAHSLGS